METGPLRIILSTLAKTTGVIAAAVLLAGFAAHTMAAKTTTALSPVLRAAATSSPAATAAAPGLSSTPAVVPNGAVLTGDQAKNLPDGTVAYKTQDGTLIAVVHGQPFPDAVVADVAAAYKATFPHGAITAKNDDISGFINQMNAYTAWMHDVGYAVGGGNVIVVADAHYVASPGIQTHGRWVEVVNNYRAQTGFVNRAAAVAAANADGARLAPALVITVDY